MSEPSQRQVPSTRCQRHHGWVTALYPIPPPGQRDRELAQLRGISLVVPQEKHAGQLLRTEASFINHLYQAHICSATVRDGIQQLTSNPKGGTWLQIRHSGRKSTERSGKTTRVRCGAQAVSLGGWRPARLKLGIQLKSELTCALASDLKTSYPPCV